MYSSRRHSSFRECRALVRVRVRVRVRVS